MKTRSVGSRKNVLIDELSVPLGGASAAMFDVYTGAGNLTINALTSDEQLLACGTLEYLENQNPPTQSLNTSDSHATLSLKSRAAGRPGFRFPWAACTGATDWRIHLNPTVQSEITAQSGGGNFLLNLGGTAVTRVSAETGGGNMDVVLPGNVPNLCASVKTGGGNVTVEVGSGLTGSSSISAGSGAGNVTVRIPNGLAARIHAKSGMGKTVIDPQFGKVDDFTYQSPDYDFAVDKVEITLTSGAGNVFVNTV